MMKKNKWLYVMPVWLAFVLQVNAQNFKHSKTFQTRDQKDSLSQVRIGNDGRHYVRQSYDAIKNYNDKSASNVYLVKFIGQPLCKTTNAKGTVSKAIADQDVVFNRFLTDMARISLSAKSGNGNTKPEITREYRKAFFGLAVKTSASIADELAKLPYVASVSKSQKVSMNNIDSDRVIGVDSVWSELGYTGEGMNIGIIDTGIDYTQEDLGNGFGEGYKVIGGYDYVNSDDNPMDDNGHGTHVSGIAAGKGITIKGVAPDANLYAYKVLDAGGSGYDFDIIAAIEQTVDPNGDNNFDDKLDVVNLSLGGGGNYLDVMCQAIDNASELGVVFCIAAGNDGQSGDFTIGSPGAALTAITVGATDFDDKIAYFSSVGPNNDIYSIKPEVMAPGVKILSTVLNHQFAEYSGTSMATPHVTGLSALVKQAHPTWGYKEIKSALMTTAKDIGLDAFKQGAGRVQAYQAVTATSLVIPSAISYGKYSADLDNWTNEENIKIINTDSVVKNYTVSFDSTSPAVSLTASPASFSIDPGDTIMINVKIDIQKSLLTDVDLNSISISGNAVFSSDADSLHIPWAVAQIVELVVNAEYNYFLSIYNEQFWKSSFIESGETIFPLKRGKYNITIQGGNRLYHFNQFEVFENSTINIDNSIPMYPVILQAFDENNNKLDGVVDIDFILSDSMSTNLMTMGPYAFTDTLYVNDIHESSQLGYLGLITKANKAYLIQATTNGFQDKGIYQNDPSAFYKQDIKLMAPKIKTMELWRYYDGWSTKNNYTGFFENNNSMWEGSFYLVDMPGNDKVIGLNYSLDNRFNSAPFKIINDSIACYDFEAEGSDSWFFNGASTNYANRYKIAKNEVYYITDGPINLILNSAHNNYESANGMGHLYQGAYSMGHNGEDLFNWDWFTFPNINFKIKDASGNIIKEGMNVDMDTMVTPDVYITEFSTTKGFSDPLAAKTVITATQDLRKEDPSAPTITSIQVRNADHVPTSLLFKDEQASIEFAVSDFIGADTLLTSGNEQLLVFKEPHKQLPYETIAVYVKNNLTDEWQKLNHTLIKNDKYLGYFMRADISSFVQVDSGNFDVKIEAADSAGNTIQGIYENCFVIINSNEPIAVDDYYETSKNKKLNVISEKGVLVNDTPNFDLFSCNVDTVQGTSNGLLAFRIQGGFTYTPNDEFTGDDSFTYVIDNCFGIADTAQVIIHVKGGVDINESESEPGLVCYPNPSKGNVKIGFDLNMPGDVLVEVYNVAGLKTTIVYNGKMDEGYNELTWRGINKEGNAAEGIYFVRLVTNDKTVVKKVVLKQ